MTISVPMKLRILLWTALAAACAVLGVLVCPRTAGAEEKGLVISEVMSRNPAIWQLDYQDYIEFYNAGDTALELSDYTLCRGDNLEKKCRLPARTVQPGEYAVLLCDGSEITFSLPKEGCRLTLLRGEETADALTLPALQKGEVWTRENGVSMQPSPGYANTDEGGAQWYQSTQRALTISEAVSCNDTLLALDGAYPDLIELQNTSGKTLRLSNYYLADSREESRCWRLPDTELAPGACYVVYASGAGGSQANFSLSAAGETLYLFDLEGQVVDALTVPALGANQSYGVWQGRYCYYDTSSIGRENEKGLRGVAQAPSMDLAAGIYANAVQVRLMGEGEIYYTTDGSAPSRASTRYQGEVLTISQPTAVRAIAYQADCLPSAITTAQYAVGLTDYSLPLLMVAAKPGALFGPYGIYTDYGNRALEAAANITLIENGAAAFSVDCGLKIHGNNSRKRMKKSFQVRFRTKYGASRLDYPLFDENPADGYHSLILRSGAQDDNHSLFRDEFFTNLTRETMPEVLCQQYKPVNLFLNGQYYGVYFIRERADAAFAAAYLGGNEDDIDMVNGWTRQEYGDKTDWIRLNDFCRRSDLQDETNYQYVLSQLCAESFIDYYIARAYTGDKDFNNIRVCRSRGGDGRWHIVNFDVDFAALFEERPLSDALQAGREDTELNTVVITALLKNEDFKALFLSRLAMHLRTTYDTQRVLSQLNALAEQVGADIARNQARWGFSVGTWQQYVQQLRDFIGGATPRISEMMWDAQRFFSLTDAQMREIFGDLWAQ